MAIGLDAVSLASIFVESVLYGIFLVLFTVSVYFLLPKRKARQRAVIPMLAVLSVMLLLATIHVAIDLRRLMNAFLRHADSQKTPAAYLSQVNTISYNVKSIAYTLQTLLGDGFVFYRLYWVWNGDKRVVIPLFVCFVASIGVGIGVLQGLANTSSTDGFFAQPKEWIVSFFALTLFTNLSCTSLIACRIWWVHRQTVELLHTRTLMPIMVVIVESGAIYSACLVILLSLYLSGSFAHFIALDAASQLIGIVFSLIVVRVGLGLNVETTTSFPETGSGPLVFADIATKTPHRQRRETKSNGAHPMQKLAVNITQITQTDPPNERMDKDRDISLDDPLGASHYEAYGNKGTEEYPVHTHEGYAV